MVASISAVATNCAAVPNAVHNSSRFRAKVMGVPVASRASPRNRMANGSPKMNRMWAAPTASGDAMSPRCIRFRNVWLSAATSVNGIQSEAG